MDPEELDELERKEMAARSHKDPYSPAGAPTGYTGEPDEDLDLGHDLEPTHPALDSNIDYEEEYQEGRAGAAEAEEPNIGNDVVEYHEPEE